MGRIVWAVIYLPTINHEFDSSTVSYVLRIGCGEFLRAKNNTAILPLYPLDNILRRFLIDHFFAGGITTQAANVKLKDHHHFAVEIHLPLV